MSRHRFALLFLLLMVATVLGALAAVGLMARHFTARADAAQQEVSTRDQRILAVIVKRNPNATIRDFADFPAFLVEQSKRYGLDYRYVMAVIDKESEWNPRAVSPAGAAGLMQLMPATAKLVVERAKMQGYQPPAGKDLGSLGDPKFNVAIGIQYLRWKIDEYGLGPDHLRAYNAGSDVTRAAPRYAEDVALRFVTLAASLDHPRPAPQAPRAPRVQAQSPVQVAEARPVVVAVPPDSPAKQAGEAVAVGLTALVTAAKSRFPSLVTRDEPRRPSLPSMVEWRPERDVDGILLPRWVRAGHP